MSNHGLPEYGHDRAYKAFQRIWQHRRMSAADLDLVVESARGGGPDPGAVEWLRKLGTRHPEACAVIEALSRDPSYLARRIALRALSVATPDEVKETVLDRLLADHEPLLRDEAARAAPKLRRRRPGSGGAHPPV